MSGDILQTETYVPLRLTVAAQVLSRSVSRFYTRRFGLGMADWRVMAVLGQYGRMKVQAIAERTAMDKVTVGRSVGRLVDRGRAAFRVDGGCRVVELTAPGLDIYNRIVPAALIVEAEVLDELSANERSALARILDKLEARTARLFAAEESG